MEDEEFKRVGNAATIALYNLSTALDALDLAEKEYEDEHKFQRNYAEDYLAGRLAMRIERWKLRKREEERTKKYRDDVDAGNQEPRNPAQPFPKNGK